MPKLTPEVLAQLNRIFPIEGFTYIRLRREAIESVITANVPDDDLEWATDTLLDRELQRKPHVSQEQLIANIEKHIQRWTRPDNPYQRYVVAVMEARLVFWRETTLEQLEGQVPGWDSNRSFKPTTPYKPKNYGSNTTLYPET